MEWNIQNLFFAFYTAAVLLLLWMFLRSPKKAKFFKKTKQYQEALNRVKRKREVSQVKTEEDAYSILGIGPEATREEIIKAYRLKIKQYHPDTVSHHGEEYKKWAKEHTLKILKAKETLLREEDRDNEVFISKTKRR